MAQLYHGYVSHNQGVLGFAQGPGLSSQKNKNILYRFPHGGFSRKIYAKSPTKKNPGILRDQYLYYPYWSLDVIVVIPKKMPLKNMASECS